MRIKFISANSNGDFYVGHICKVTRGISGGNKEKKIVEEVLIVGIPKARMHEWCLKHNVKVWYNPEQNRVIDWCVENEKGEVIYGKKDVNI